MVRKLMNNSFLFSLGFLFSFLSFSFFAYGVGFHPASDIISGVFQGNFTFDGNVSLNGSDNGIHFTDGTVQTTAYTGVGIPSGFVGFFNLSSCPSGWDEATDANGRVIVGISSSKTLEATVGSALADSGTRTITDVPSHYHSVDPPSTSSSTDGSHSHSYAYPAVTNRDDGGSGGGWAGSSGASTGAAGSHSHTVDIGSFNSGTTGVASVDVTMPYIQYLVCIKS